MKWFEEKKENEYLEKRIKELEAKVRKYENAINGCNARTESLNDEYRKQIEQKDSQIEKLQSELDILHKHFKLDEAPSQSTRVAVRTDERVHALEIENAELKAKLYYADKIMDALKPKVNADWYPGTWLVKHAL